ncbi:hypothetical protein IC582_018448 [Cucumis melo]
MEARLNLIRCRSCLVDTAIDANTLEISEKWADPQFPSVLNTAIIIPLPSIKIFSPLVTVLHYLLL